MFGETHIPIHRMNNVKLTYLYRYSAGIPSPAKTENNVQKKRQQ